MTADAVLAAEIERRVRELGRSPAPTDAAISLGYYIAGQVQQLLAALRASRPEPAGDVVEAVARAIDEDTAGVWLPYNVSRIGAARVMARAALAALPRPEADEGAAEYRSALLWVFSRLGVDRITPAEVRRTMLEVGKVLQGKPSPAARYEPNEWDESAALAAAQEGQP
jgi:hypothetical protein